MPLHAEETSALLMNSRHLKNTLWSGESLYQRYMRKSITCVTHVHSADGTFIHRCPSHLQFQEESWPEEVAQGCMDQEYAQFQDGEDPIGYYRRHC